MELSSSSYLSLPPCQVHVRDHVRGRRRRRSCAGVRATVGRVFSRSREQILACGGHDLDHDLNQGRGHGRGHYSPD